MTLHTQQKRVLVIEDDHTLEAILAGVLRSISPSIELDWVDSAENALIKIKQGILHKDRSYSLIIADIFLEGTITGIEFWQTCNVLCPNSTFLIMSSMPTDYFFKTIGLHTISPPFLSKPIRSGECRDMIAGLLKYEKTHNSAA